MARPAIFQDRASINIYLHRQQKDLLVRKATVLGKSPSQIVREMLDKELGQ